MACPLLDEDPFLEEPFAHADKEPVTAEEHRSDQPGSKVLVVEDDAVMASAIESLLRRFGHACTSATSAEGALDSLDAAPFDLMVSDVNLGTGGSGLELVAAAKSGDPDLAVLMVSGLDDPDTANAALDLGAFGYIIKPFAMNELRIGVSNALRRRELEVAQRSHLARLESEVLRRTAELQAVSDDLRARESRFRSLATATPLGVVYVRLDGSCEYANRSAEVLLGCRSGQLDQHNWLAGVDSTDRKIIEQSIRGAHSGVPGSDHEHGYRRPDGSATWLRTHIAPVTDDQGGIAGVLALFEDIETRKRLEIRLRHQAMHDHLTGLPNRRFLKECLTERLATAGGDRLGLFMVDFDQFKLVNDTYGHETGDELIVAMARRLSEWAGEDRVVARLGGDEFVIISPGLSRDGILEDAESLHRAISGPMALGSVELHLSASIGVALPAGRRPHRERPAARRRRVAPQGEGTQERDRGLRRPHGPGHFATTRRRQRTPTGDRRRLPSGPLPTDHGRAEQRADRTRGARAVDSRRVGTGEPRRVHPDRRVCGHRPSRGRHGAHAGRRPACPLAAARSHRRRLLRERQPLWRAARPTKRLRQT